MKPKPIPTSPKERARREEQIEQFLGEKGPQTIEKPGKRMVGRAIATFLVALVIGFVSGALGTIFVGTYGSEIPFLKDFQLPIDLSSIVVRTPAQSEGIASPATQRLIEKLAGSHVSIFKKKQETATGIDALYMENDRTGFGVALTDDGVLVTTNDALPDVTTQYVGITVDGQVLDISNISVDPLTQARVFRLAGDAFTTLPFASSENIAVGMTAMYVENHIDPTRSSFFQTILTDTLFRNVSSAEELVKPSETVSEYYRIQDALPLSYSGVGITTTDGQLLGIYLRDGTVLPIAYLSTMVPDYLVSQDIRRPYLGVRTLDLGRAVNAPSALSQGSASGALIYTPDSAQPAIVKKSPAQKAGLKEGDIIIALDDVVLTKELSLASALLQFSVGDIVTLTIRREGKEQKLKIELEQLK